MYHTVACRLLDAQLVLLRLGEVGGEPEGGGEGGEKVGE